MPDDTIGRGFFFVDQLKSIMLIKLFQGESDEGLLDMTKRDPSARRLFAEFQKIVMRRDALARRLKRLGTQHKDYRQARISLRSLARTEGRMAERLMRCGLPYLDRPLFDFLSRLSETRLIYGRGTLIGSLAFVAYSGLFGAAFEKMDAAINDLDVIIDADASVRASESVDIAYVLGADDMDIPRPLPTSFISAEGILVDFLALPHGPGRKIIPLPGVKRAGAYPLAFYYDYLVASTVRTVFIGEGAGVPVQVPAPERYAIHKLISASDRLLEKSEGRRKDLSHASQLIALLAAERPEELRKAWNIVCKNGGEWANHLRKGAKLLTARSRMILGALLNS